MLTTKRENKQKWKIVNENLKQEVALVNLLTMWQPLRSLATTQHAQGSMEKKKKVG
jgi:hypothetical protein